jgi:hypothetical protein
MQRGALHRWGQRQGLGRLLITEATFNGGSLYSTALSVTLNPASPRVIVMANGGGPAPLAVNLFDASARRLDPGQVGGPRFIVIKTSTHNTQIKKADGTVLATLTGNGVGEVTLSDPDSDTWIVRSLTWGTPQAGGRGTMEAISSTDEADLVDPFCFEGDDCAYANADPLDGEEGRELVVAPMFEDVVEYAKNTYREPVRAASVYMPSKIVVRLSPGEFVPDPLHPRAATVLSDDFYRQLENEGNPHLLEFDAVGSYDGASHNPYHARALEVVGPGTLDWSLDSLSVVRRVWKKTISYDVDGAAHSIEIRFVMEYSNEAILGQATKGIWGSLFMLYVFASEIHPTFVEGGAFTAAGFGASNNFTKDDPILWGGAVGVSGGTDADKGCHPQLAIAAAIKTTWHAPFNYLHIPLQDRKYAMGIPDGDAHGYNREYAYKRPNCSPWVSDPDRDETFCTGCADLEGVRYITHFGQVIGGFIGAAMTRGGSFPRSTIPESLCIENGLATGQTYLIPERPGWDEEIGQFIGEGSITVAICVNDEDWAHDDVSGCDGFPGDKLADIGGSHHCFRNDEDSATRCCISIVAGESDPQYYTSQGGTVASIAYAYEYCRRIYTVVGPRDGSACEILEAGCRVSGWFYTSRTVLIDDYNYFLNGNQLLRQLDWKRHVPDPDQVRFNHTYESGDVDVVQEVGSWSLLATASVTAVNAAKTAKAVALYEPAGAAYRDMVVSATALGATLASHGLVARGQVDGSDNLTGYVGIVTPTGVGTGTVAIKYYNAGTATTLVTRNIVLDDDTVDLVFEVWGNELRLDYEVSGGEAGSVTAYHCTIQDGGYPGICTETNGTDAEFQDWIILDTGVDFVVISGYIGYQTISVSFPDEAKYGYGQCDSIFNPDCGNCCEPERCNCTTWSETPLSSTIATWSAASDMGETDPTYCGGPFWDTSCQGTWCDGRVYPCGSCPEPFVCLSLCIPTRCLDDVTAEPNMCKGISAWCRQPFACL